jgi:hypothetical protein
MPEVQVIAEERWNSLLDSMELGKVVPIVGRSLSLVEVDGSPPMPVQRAAVQAMTRELGIESFPDNIGLADLYRRMAEDPEFDVETFHPKLRRVLAAFRPQLDPLNKLAEITHFRLYLSTAFDGYLGQAVRELRGAQGETVTTYTFAPGYENPQQAIVRTGEVCVYNLLGGRDTFPNWAVTMEEMVEFVLGMHGEKYRPDQLFAALKDRHLLAIGCQIPDWLGRFFLRALRDGRISEQKGMNHLVEDAVDADAALGRYLQTFSKKSLVVPGNAVAFVDELNRRWKTRVGDAPPPGGNGANGISQPERVAKVFLSYAHDDGHEAQRLYDYLRARGIDVWKDDRQEALAKGGNWDHEIRRQIADCACFVPVISRHTTDTSESYFWQEWNLALDRSARMNSLKRRFIFPVLCERDVKLPEQFKDSQWTLLSDDVERAALAQSLSDEQRRLRKEAR